MGGKRRVPFSGSWTAAVSMRPPRALSTRPTLQAPGQRDTAAEGLVERAALVLATTSLRLVFGVQEPVLLRLLAEPTGARSGDAELGCRGPDGDAAAEQGGGIANVPGILMKQAEQARGTPLSGLAVKVTNGFFFIALSAVDTDVQRNIQLLKEQSWFDIPIVYTNGGRAILAME
jgi:hypothetical protein